MHELVFVLEQTLGHAAHARNIRRVLERQDRWIHSTVIPIEFQRRSGLTSHIPGIRTWSFEASLQARSALARRARTGDIAAAFIHTQVAALLAGSMMKTIPTVVSLDATPRNFDSQGASYGHSRNMLPVEAVKTRINQAVFRRAAALVTWCRWAADSLVADYDVPEEKITVIHPGVDLRLFRPDDTNRSGRPVRILFVGGDFERKGGSDLLQAMVRLGSAAELDVITGSDVAPPPGVTCRVHRGLTPQSPEVLQLYREADIFALPSRGDCFPQAVAEGLASGLPVVATRVGAIPEMIQDGVNGYLVPSASQRQLGEALERLVHSSALRRELGTASRRLAERDHDADANNTRILELMLMVGGRSRHDLQVA